MSSPIQNEYNDELDQNSNELNNENQFATHKKKKLFAVIDPMGRVEYREGDFDED